MSHTEGEDAPLPRRKAGVGRRRAPGALLVALFLLGCPTGCMSPDEYRDEADEAAYGIVGRARTLAGQKEDPDFHIDPADNALRREFFPERSGPEDTPLWERLATDDHRVVVNLESALQLAALNSREFQSQKERLYNTALSLTSAVRNFESRWFGTVDLSGRSAGDGDDSSTLSLAESSSLGFTRLLERGGSFSLSIGDSVTRFLTNPASTTATTFASLALSLPFLRGAGREVAYESVTQAERDVVYAVRDFERFKRVFAVDVVSDYLRLLQSAQTIDNELANYERRKITAEENRLLGEAGRLARTDVERANQAELAAENRWIVAKENFENALDRFKLRLGLPTDAVVEIDQADLKRIRERGAQLIELDAKEALVKALRWRLDLATSEARVADAKRQIAITANALEAGLDFNATLDLNSNDFGEKRFRLDAVGSTDGFLGLSIDLPLDRVDERNAYRRALINFQAARRDFEAFEDQVKLDVRRDLRNLRQASETFRIQKRAEEVAQTNVEAANLLKAAGIGNTNDLLDAQNDLVTAQNAVTQALIDYTIARLQLLRDMGVLIVEQRGIDEKSTEALLMQEEKPK